MTHHDASLALAPATYSDGHPLDLYDRLRNNDPVSLATGFAGADPFYVLSRYEDIRAVSLDTKRYTSTKGFNIRTSSLGVSEDPMFASVLQNILGFDPPLHTEFKQALLPGFTPAKLNELELITRAFTSELLDGFHRGQEIDFVAEIASPIPIRVLCHLLGIPLEDEHNILGWTNQMVGAEDPRVATEPLAVLMAYKQVYEYGRWLIEERKKDPKDDLMSLVAATTLNGEPLSEATRDGMCATMIAAGNETTRNSMTGMVLLLSEAAEQRHELASDPSLLPNAIEEMLRRYTPVIHMTRAALEPVQIGDVRIEEGNRVAMLYGAANHDPAVFDAPRNLDIRRPNARKHLAFGTGIHLCIGQRLAQMELRVLFEELLKRFPNTVAIGEPDYLQSGFVSSIRELQVKLN